METLKITDVYQPLDVVILRWRELRNSRLKGTKRNLHRARYTGVPGGDPTGFTDIPAPLHLDVIDTMANVLDSAHRLHEDVAQAAGIDRLDPPTSAYVDARPYALYARTYLHLALDAKPEMLEAAYGRAMWMQDATLTLLGEMYDGQTLEAICPFCIGRTFRHPAGERTLRVRLVESRVKPGTTELVIVCENPDACHPFAHEVGMWVKDRPAWPWSQWEWLAERLLAVPQHARGRLLA